MENKTKCDFCDNEALYDAKTKIGPWANLCPRCFIVFGIGLGMGKGQKLKPESNKAIKQ